MRLLIVDDDENGLLVLQRALRHHGYQVDTAINGKLALEQAREQSPDLIISDIMMPEMDGFELCHHIKQDPQLKTIPFIFYTATYIDQEDEALAKSLGAAHFVIKPLPIEKVIDLINNSLEEHHKELLKQQDLEIDSSDATKRHESILTNKLTKKVNQLKQERFKLFKLNQELEQRIAERTAELVLAKEKAEAANKAKSTFLATMSHELRTPLNSILGFTQIMLKQHKLDDEQQRYLNTIWQSGEHLLRLINNVLNISKIEAGHTQISRNKLNLHLFLENIIDMFQYQTRSPDIKIKLLFDEAVPAYVETDEGKLRQMIINLMGNAVKFTPQGHINLNIKMENDNKTLVISIEDTGIGIPVESQEDIFGEFKKSVQHDYDSDGTGLGLAVSRKLARLLGGDIKLRSKPGKGSTFTLTVPILIPKKISLADKHSQHEVTGLAPKTSHPRILVVDDIATNREVLVKQLELVGFDVRGVISGTAAISELESWHANLILLDRVMPGLDGIETMKRIRLIPDHKKTPIIIVSASIMEDEQQECLLAGADGFISKPTNNNELFVLIANLLGIKYQYVDSDKYIKQRTVKILTAEELTNVPTDWLKEMLKTTRVGDTEEMLAIAGACLRNNLKLKTKLPLTLRSFNFSR